MAEAADQGSHPIRRSDGPLWVGTAILAFLAVAAALAAYYATAYGPWTYSDGVGYMVSAKNLTTGHGLGLFKPSGQFEALVSHPPLYPLTLAALMKLGLDPVQAARWVSIITFGAFICVIPLLYRRTTGSVGHSVALAVLLASAPAILLSYLGSMAETLFLPLGFSGLLALGIHLKEGGRTWLLAAAVLLALSTLSRYPAIAFVLAATTLVLIVPHDSVRHRIGKAMLLTATTFAGLALFLLWSRLAFGGGAPRAAQPGLRPVVGIIVFPRGIARVLWEWKPIPPPEVIQFILSPAWVQPLRVALVLGLTVFTLLGIASITFKGSASLPSATANSASVTRLMAIVIFWYVALLAAAYFFTYPTPDIDSRTMLPILIAVAIGLVAGFEYMEQRVKVWQVFRAAELGLIAAILVGNGLMSWDIAQGLHRTGSGFTGAAWRRSETMNAVSRIPLDTTVISNAPEAVLLYLDRYPNDITLFRDILESSSEVGSCSTSATIITILFDLEGADGEMSEQLESIKAEVSERGLGELSVATYSDGTLATIEDLCP